MDDIGRLNTGSVQSASEPMDFFRSEFYRSLPEAWGWDAAVVDDILVKSDKMNLPAGSMLLRPDSQCDSFIVLLDGTIRVFQNEGDGREITLYRIRPGDFCIMSLNSLLRGQQFNATACAETPIRALSISKRQFLNLVTRYETFSVRVLESLTDHFSKILSLMEDIAFSRLEYRLVCLLEKMFEAGGDGKIKVTHLELANELGTTREVMSRILKNLEKQGCVKLARGQISLTAKNKLYRFKSSHQA